MSMELEVKILDINKVQFIEKLTQIGAIFKEKTIQKLYTYDLPTIYNRFMDILLQLNDNPTDIQYEILLDKYKLFAFEIDNLLVEKERNQLIEITNYSCFYDLLKSDNFIGILNNKELHTFVSRFKINPNKWVRVRQTGDKTTITVKHILANNETSIQQLQETEINVDNIESADKLLEALGFSHKLYQEKERITYLFDGHEIDIDTWPNIPTFFEVEGSDVQDLKHILGELGYTLEQSVSCTADKVYEKYNKSMFDSREMKL